MILVCALLAVAAGSRLHLDCTFQLEGKTYASDFFSDLGHGKLYYSDYASRHVLEFEVATKRTRKLGFGQLKEGTDSGLGLLTYASYDSTTRISNVILFNPVKGEIFRGDSTTTRIGRLLWAFDRSFKVVNREKSAVETLDAKLYDRRRLWLAPVWIGPKRWIWTKGGDSKDLVEVVPGTERIVRSVHLSDYAMGPEGVVGNPEVGAFAVIESNNRTEMTTGIFNSHLKRIGPKALQALDISRTRILAVTATFDQAGYCHPKELVALDSESGRTLWKHRLKRPELLIYGGFLLRNPRFIGSRYAIVAGELIDTASGKSVQQLPFVDQGILDIHGKTVYVFVNPMQMGKKLQRYSLR